MFKRVVKGMCILMIISLILVGCGSQNSEQSAQPDNNQAQSQQAPKEEEPKQDEQKPYNFVLICKSLSNPYFITMKEGAEDEAKKYNVNLTVQAPEREIDVEKQIQMLENAITQKVDAILITPSGASEVVSAVKKANDANIPVIDIDEKIDSEALKADGASIATFIGSDNYLGGQIAAEYMIEALNGEGKVAIIEGVPGHAVSVARVGGFSDTIKEKSKIEIVASQTANWERDQGFNVFENILTANPDIDGVFAASDLMALGAVEAIQQAGKDGIIVIGFDANDEAKEAVKNGAMAGTVAQYPEEMGRIAIQKAIELLEGKEIDKEIPVKVELITKDKLQ